MKEYIDDASPYASATAATADRTTILTHELKNGKRPFLLAFRNSISAGGETYCAFSLLLNGVPLEDFDRVFNQVAAPEDQQGNMLRRRELPQGATLSVVVDNSDAANTYVATAKVEVAYESL